MLTLADLTKRYSASLPKQERQKLLVENRDIQIGYPQEFFPNNQISTTKYTLYSFLFVNLYEQFSKIANLYFLFLACLQMVKIVSITHGIPTILPPLAFIVTLTMIKDVYEDYKRYKSDQEENDKVSQILSRDGKYYKTLWRDIKVGMIVRVNKNEFFPADLVLLGSSDFKKGQCFIETKNLDGETNLKARMLCPEFKEMVKAELDVTSLAGSLINSEGPNTYLYRFKGSTVIKNDKIPLSADNFLLRGCILRNTDYILGCVVYTG